MARDRAVLVNSGNSLYEGAIPLGLMAVATILQRQHSVRCEIVDLPLEQPDRLEAQIASFWQGKDFSDVLFVGFSTLCNTLPRTLSLARSLRTVAPDLPIVLGGPEASARGQDLLGAYPFIDAVVIGEIETVASDLVAAVRGGERQDLPGLMFQTSSGMHANGHHDTGRRISPAPLADLNLSEAIDYGTYPQATSAGAIPIEVGRGCPYGCTFCSTKGFFSRRFRLKSPERIVEEIAALMHSRHVRHLDFIHDMFVTNRKLVVSICEALIRSGLSVTWACSARTDRVDEELLRLMMRAGCTGIYFGIETGSPRIQKLIQKNLDLADAMDKIALATRLGMHVTTSMIIGFPQEEEEDLVQTLDLLLRLRRWQPSLASVQLHLLAPLAGTELTAGMMDELRYDGHARAETSVNRLTEWEETEVRTRPGLFSSFYYYPNRSISRSTYKWLHHAMAEQRERGGSAFPIEADASGERILRRARRMGPYPVLGPHARWGAERWARFLAPALAASASLSGAAVPERLR